MKLFVDIFNRKLCRDKVICFSDIKYLDTLLNLSFSSFQTLKQRPNLCFIDCAFVNVPIFSYKQRFSFPLPLVTKGFHKNEYLHILILQNAIKDSSIFLFPTYRVLFIDWYFLIAYLRHSEALNQDFNLCIFFYTMGHFI